MNEPANNVDLMHMLVHLPPEQCPSLTIRFTTRESCCTALHRCAVEQGTGNGTGPSEVILRVEALRNHDVTRAGTH